MIVTSLFNGLGKDDQVLMGKFSSWLQTNKNAAESACLFLANKIGDKGLIDDFKNLSAETKLQACQEYLMIGLTAGSVKRKEVEKLLKK
jgi:hypothetical protein